MPAKKQAKGGDKRGKITQDLYQFRKCFESGFPSKCSAIAYDERLKLLAVGTKGGAIKVFGQPGVEFVGQHADNSEVQKLLFVTEQARLVAFCVDGTAHLWELNFDASGQGNLEEVRSVALTDADRKTIEVSSQCLSHDAHSLFLGTTNGFVYILRLPELTLSEAPLRPDVLLTALPKKHSSSPGSVEGLAVNPQNPDQLLIGYSHGLVVSYLVSQGHVDAAYHCQDASITSLSVHRDGNQLVTAHEDGSYVYWHLHPAAGSSDEEASDDENDEHKVTVMKLKKSPTVVYGPKECRPITKLAVKSSDKGDLLMFIGGMPRAAYGDKFTVSAIRGKQHVAYELTSKVIDFVVVDSNDLMMQHDNPDLLIVLAEEELVAIDLQSDQWQQTLMPYMATIHSSAITFSTHFSNIDQKLWSKLRTVGEAQLRRFNCSIRSWPINGGRLLQQDVQYCARDLFVTGHESGAVNFWDASGTGSISWLCKLSTAKLFKGEFADAIDGHVDENEPDSPPFRKVGVYDPYSDDPRLAVQKVVLCSEQLSVAVGGAAGQVMLFQLNDNDRENVLPIVERDVIKCNIVASDEKFVWKGWEALPIRDSEVNLPAGFHPSALIELNPPAAVSALDFSAAWNVIVAGTAHGFSIVDIAQRKQLLARCTLNLADEMARQAAQAGPMQKMRSSLRKSLRQSVRRMRRARDSVRRSMRRKGGRGGPADKKGNKLSQAGGKEKVLRSQSNAETRPANDAAAGDQRGEVNTALVRTVLLAETYVNSSSQRQPSAIAATNGGVAFLYSITPASSGGGRKCDLHKQLVLQHKAAIMQLAVLRGPDMTPVGVSDAGRSSDEQHHLLVFSEEQIKLFSLPGLKAKCKAKLFEADGRLIRKATVASLRTRHGAQDVTENHPVVLTSTGELVVYHLDSHGVHPEFDSPCIKQQDAVGINSCALTRSAHGYYHSSPSEFMRFSSSARNQQAPRCTVTISETNRVMKNLGRPASTSLASVAPSGPRASVSVAPLTPITPPPSNSKQATSPLSPQPKAELTISAQAAPKAQSAPPPLSPNGDDSAAVYYSMPPDVAPGLPPKSRTSAKPAAEPPKLLATVDHKQHAKDDDEDEDSEEEEESESGGEADLHPPAATQKAPTLSANVGAKLPAVGVSVHAGAAVNNGPPHHDEDDEEEEEEDDDDV